MSAHQDLLGKYIESAIIQGKECWGGNVEVANSHTLIMRECYSDLCLRGQEGVDALTSLLNHDNADVRLNAAFGLLPFKPKESMRALRKLSRSENEVAFRAENTLLVWKRGLSQFAMKREGKIVHVSAEELVCSLKTEWAKVGAGFGGPYNGKPRYSSILSYWTRMIRKFIRK